MSEIEQECISRLVEQQELFIDIVGWGHITTPKVVFGDMRIGFSFRLHFDRPEFPMPVHYFDMVLKTKSGIILYKERQSTIYGGKPVNISAGVYLDMVWDIALTSIDPKIVKEVMPLARGLTSRLQDRDTKQFTLFGNNSFNEKQKQVLFRVRKGEAQSRRDTAKKTKTAENLAKK